MKNSNCTVCGLHKEACLHQQNLKELRKDHNVIRLLWFMLGFLTAISGYFFSCTTSHFVTSYKISTPERNYYVNHFKIVNDTIYCAELKRNGKLSNVYALPYSTSKIEESK
jgi:hypothetical protein